jgi:hypothetical protein
MTRISQLLYVNCHTPLAEFAHKCHPLNSTDFGGSAVYRSKFAACETIGES